MRRSARGMPTSLSPSIASSRARRDVTSLWSITASTSWSPIESTGLSDVIGSWKIIEISLPRSSRRRRFDARRRFSPRNRASPVETEMCFFVSWRNASICAPAGASASSEMRPGFGLRSRIDIIVTLLPEPDSPTTPSVCPGRTSNETPSTALTIPSSVLKYVRRSRTESNGGSRASCSRCRRLEAGGHASLILGSMYA